MGMHKKALVTGVAGFVMSHVAAELLEHGWSVVGLDNYQSHGAAQLDFVGHPHYTHVIGDARDGQLLGRLLDDCSDCIAGAAHCGGSGYLRDRSYEIYRDNQRLTEAAVEAALAHHARGRLRRLTLISSSMVFEQAHSFPVADVDQIPAPRQGYGFQKLAAQRLAEAAALQYGLPYGVLIYFNHAGPGRYAGASVPRLPEQVLPELARRILASGAPVEIWGDGQQRRHFTHGRDLARGTRLALDAPAAAGRALQIASPESTTVLQAARSLWQLLRPDQEFAYSLRGPVAGDVLTQMPDCQPARELLGFEACHSLRDILQEIVAAIRQEARQAPAL